MQRLDRLRNALHGPDAREALHAMFPQGMILKAAPDAFHIEANGVVELRTVANAAPLDDHDHVPQNLPTVRQPDEIRIPVAIWVPDAPNPAKTGERIAARRSQYAGACAKTRSSIS